MDYYIIESIYQNVFNSLGNISSFKYIDSLFSETKREEIKTSNYVTYQMLDKTIIWKQRVLSSIEKLLSKMAQKVSDWFPSFIQVKKNEIELLFKSEIEHFKTEVGSELANKFNAELEQNKTLIEQLKKTILEKDKRISQLENQIKENTQTFIENENKKEVAEKDDEIRQNEQIIDSTDLNTKKTETINTYEFQDVDIQSNLAQESVGPLFSDDSLSLRESELKNMKEDELKSVAKKYKITKRKTDLIIAEIIKHEFKQ